jgi:hypothetical protein
MKKLNLKALFYTALMVLGLAVVAVLGFYFPMPMLLCMGIFLVGTFSYQAYQLFSQIYDKEK